MASDGKDMPRMTVKAFKESKKVELSCLTQTFSHHCVVWNLADDLQKKGNCKK